MAAVMNKLMFQFEHPDGAPTVEEAMSTYGLKRDEIDADFGVVPVDRERSIYVVLIDEDAAARLQEDPESERSDVEGVFSNPPIEPFGPPQS